MRGSQRRKVLRAKLRRQRAGIEEKVKVNAFILLINQDDVLGLTNLLIQSEDEQESSPNSSDSELENMKCECCGRGDDDDKVHLT